MSVINFFVECIPWLKEFVFDQILTEIINTTKNRLFNGHLKTIEKGKFEIAYTTVGYKYWEKDVPCNGDYLLNETGLPIRNMGQTGVDILHMDVFVNGNQTRNITYKEGEDHYSTGEINSTKNVNLNLNEIDKKHNELNVVILLLMKSDKNMYVQEITIKFQRCDENRWRRISCNTDIFFEKSKLDLETKRISES